MQRTMAILVCGVAAYMVSAPQLSAQPLPENSAACQGGCDGGSRDFNTETENIYRATRNYNRGVAKLKKQDFLKAAKFFEKAAKTAPEKADFNYMAGSSYYFSKKHELAKIYLANALAIEGDEGIDPGQREIAEDMLRQMAQK